MLRITTTDACGWNSIDWICCYLCIPLYMVLDWFLLCVAINSEAGLVAANCYWSWLIFMPSQAKILSPLFEKGFSVLIKVCLIYSRVVGEDLQASWVLGHSQFNNTKILKGGDICCFWIVWDTRADWAKLLQRNIARTTLKGWGNFKGSVKIALWGKQIPSWARMNVALNFRILPRKLL